MQLARGTLCSLGALSLSLLACGNPEPPESRQAADAPPAPDPDHIPDAPGVAGPRIDVKQVVMAPPFVGEEGEDVHGYPLRQPDMVELLSMLRLQRFDVLEHWMTHYQEAFEKDYRKEQWPDVAVSAFFVADPTLGDLIDAWTRHSPDHFAPWVARGNYRYKMGQHYRGGAFANSTSLAQFKSMGEFYVAALEDFERASKLEPQLVAGHRRMIQMAAAGSQDERAYLDAATARCKLCVSVRVYYMHALTPRWGGSYEAMQEYLREIRPLVKDNPKLGILSGHPDWDRCRTFREAKQFEQAAAACDAALAAGDYPEFLVQRARLYDEETQADKVLPLLDRALRLQPQDRGALRRRFVARGTLKNYLGAAQDILAARHLQPTNKWVAGRVKWIVDVLRFQGQELSKAAKDTEALPYFTLGLELAPDDRDLRRRAAWSQKAVGFGALDKQIAERPDDFELRLQRDHGLAAMKKYAEVDTMWTEFIGRHPTDPRPHWERAGARWHLGRHADAIADMERTCALGLDKGCQDAKKMKASAPN